jgi:hypothetical protein
MELAIIPPPNHVSYVDHPDALLSTSSSVGAGGGLKRGQPAVGRRELAAHRLEPRVRLSCPVSRSVLLGTLTSQPLVARTGDAVRYLLNQRIRETCAD